MSLKFPRLLEYGTEASYAPLVKWFRSYLRMNTREAREQQQLSRYSYEATT